MSAGFATLVARGARSSSVRKNAAPTFDEIVELFEPNVVSYWKFHNTGTDEEGQENAIITGAPEPDVPTIVKFDTIASGALTDGKCIAWPGTAGDFAEAPNDAAHKTVAGTIVVYFQRDAASEKSQLIQADSPTTAGMAMGININGAPDAYIRDGGGTAIQLAGGVGDVLLDRAYVLIFKWGSGGGMRLALYNDAATLVRFATNASTIGLSGNTAPIRFGATHGAAGTEVNHHDGPYARVIWMNRRITDAEELSFAQASTIARSASAYRDLELSMDPLSLWGLGEASGTQILDAVGGHNGTYAGTILHNASDLPVNSIDGAINFSADGGVTGTGSGSVPADGLSLDVFSLSLWFIANHIPGEGVAGVPLVIKGAASPVEGDFSLFIRSNGAGTMRLNLRDATSTVAIDTPAVAAAQPYHVCVRANNTGVELYLDGVFMGAATTITAGWSNNNNPLTFATGLSFAALGNCILDEVCLIPRFITVAEVIALAQKSGIAPVAVGAPAIVPELTTTVLDVLANDTYVGSPTIEIMAPPGGGDFATVVPATSSERAHVTYQAGDVTTDTVRSFNYRIHDPNGTSNTVTVSVTVQADDFVATPIANCFTIPGSGATLQVNSAAEMEAAVNAAAPGDHIVFPPGTYAGGTRNLDPQGTAANPIVIRPTTGRNNVTITNAVWTLGNNSARVVFYGLNFNGGGTVNPTNGTFIKGVLDINGQHHRVSRCQFRQINAATCVVRNATDTRIDHCDYADYVNPSNHQRHCVKVDSIALRGGSLQRLLIDYCHFHDIVRNPDQGSECGVVMFGGSAGDGRANGHCIIDHCLTEDCSMLGSSEIMLVKQSGVTIRFCTFRNLTLPSPPNWAGQYIQQRQGAGLELRSCWFENTGSSTPIRVPDYEPQQTLSAGRAPLIIGNNIRGTGNLSITRGSGEPLKGEQPGGDGFYNACCNARVIGNILQNGQILVGNFVAGPGLERWPGAEGLASDNHFQANVREAGQTTLYNMQDEVRSVFHPADAPLLNEPFEPAVRLNPVEVGLGAPDPLCTGANMPQG